MYIHVYLYAACVSSNSRRKKDRKLFIVTHLVDGWISHARNKIYVKSWYHLISLALNCSTTRSTV